MSGMDQLLHLLASTLNPDQHIQAHAEQQLVAASQQPGFAPALVHIALQSDHIEQSLRQLALVVLKKYIREHWDDTVTHFQPPLCSDTDKADTRRLLPQALGSSSSKLRTAAAMAIAAVAKTDFPAQWPGMLEWMLQTLWQQQDANLVMGVLNCLSMLAEDIEEQQLATLLPNLLPTLLNIINNPAYQTTISKHILSIIHSVLAQLGIIQGAYRKQVRDLLTPLLLPWMPVLTDIIKQPLTKEPSCWALKLECLQIVVALINNFSKPFSTQVPVLMAACWQLFAGSARAMYHELLVLGDDREDVAGVVESDDEGVGLEAMLAQNFEVLLVLVGNPRFSKLLKPALSDLASVSIDYMQMTAPQAESWADNPNTYVADEEDAMYTARVSGELLLDELCKEMGLPAVVAVLTAVERAVKNAEQARVAGGSLPGGSWWKLREAAILAVGAISESLQLVLAGHGDATALMTDGNVGAQRRTKQAKAAAVEEQEAFCKAIVQALLDSMLSQDLQGQHSNPFLAGRALWAAAKLATLMSPTHISHYFQAACAGIRSTLPAPVRIGACRALVQLLPLADKLGVQSGNPALASAFPSLYEGLMCLLNESSEETLHLVLETLRRVIQHDSTCVIRQYLSDVSSPVLRVWEGSVADPLIGEDATDVLEALAAHPECLVPLVNQLVPALVRVISEPTGQRPMMVEASLQLLRGLIRRPTVTRTHPANTAVEAAAPVNDAVAAQHQTVVQQVYVAVVSPLLALIDRSMDSSEQEEAQQLLCQLIRYGRSPLLSWGGGQDPSSTVLRLMTSLMRLLQPSMGEEESALAGHLAADMINAFPWPIMQPHIPVLVEAVCRRLVRVNYSPLVNGLIMVLSLCVRASCQDTLNMLTRFNVTLSNGQELPALSAVLPIWMERASDIHGQYQTALVVTALGALLESGSPHLQNMQVKGKRLDMTTAVRTRSQVAAGGGEQYSQVPVPAKLVATLAQVLADRQEASRLDDGSVGLWAEEDEDEEEGDEEEDEGDEGEDNEDAANGLDPLSPRRGVRGLEDACDSDLVVRNLMLSAQPTGSRNEFVGGGAALGVRPLGLLDVFGESEGGGGPLSPSSALHTTDVTAGDDAAPPGDPLAKLDVGKWVSELFQRLALQATGRALLQASSELVMTRRQTDVLQKLLQASRLRP